MDVDVCSYLAYMVLGAALSLWASHLPLSVPMHTFGFKYICTLENLLFGYRRYIHLFCFYNHLECSRIKASLVSLLIHFVCTQ